MLTPADELRHYLDRVTAAHAPREPELCAVPAAALRELLRQHAGLLAVCEAVLDPANETGMRQTYLAIRLAAAVEAARGGQPT